MNKQKKRNKKQKKNEWMNKFLFRSNLFVTVGVCLMLDKVYIINHVSSCSKNS